LLQKLNNHEFVLQVFSDGLLLVVIARGETDIPAAVALFAGLLHSPRQICLNKLLSALLPRHSKSSNVILNVKKIRDSSQ
jgi:hypothetical protein